MNPFSFPRQATPFVIAGSLLFLAACRTSPNAAEREPAGTPSMTAVGDADLRTLDYSGSQQAVVAIDDAIKAAGTDRAKQAAIAAQLVSVLRDSNATFAGRQAAAQRLSLFPATDLLRGENRTAFVALLLDDRTVDLARLALDLVPGQAIDDLYLEALDKAAGRPLLAIVQTVGNRRIPRAVPKLKSLLGGADSAVASEAVKALGRIGTHDALQALDAAANPGSGPVVEARLEAANRVGGAEATRVFIAISSSGNSPAPLRAAAVHGLLLSEPKSAADRIIAVLDGKDPIAKAVVIEAVATAPVPSLVATLGRQLGSWDAPTQTAVIAALGRRGDPAAEPAIVAATRQDDPLVRAAALDALARLRGTPEIARLLAGVAAGDRSDDAKLARLSLARLTGPGVADAITDGAAHAATPLRIIFLEQIAARDMTSSIPLLLATRKDADATVRSAALGALAEIGSPAQQTAILDWAIGAPDTTEQSRALRALASVTLRNLDQAGRARAVTEGIERAQPDVALRLLPVLPRIGGAASAESAARLGLRADPTLANAAVTTLSRWSDESGLVPLVTVAEKATRDSIRAAAMQGAVRYLDRSRHVPSAELGELVQRLLATTQDPALRTQLVFLLGRAADPTSLALATKLEAEPALATEAAAAAMAIRANQLGRPALAASSAIWQLPNLLDGKPSTHWGTRVQAGQWLRADLRASRPIRRVVLQGDGDTYPEHLELFVTDDPANEGTALASANGHPGKNTIELPAGTQGRYLIIRQTASREEGWWSVTELLID